MTPDERATLLGHIGTADDDLLSLLWNIRAERGHQDRKWGEQNHEDLYWLGILMEEVGETAKALIERPVGKATEGQMVREMIQVLAVCAAWYQCIERRKRKEQSGG